jgi:hypothetical protein
MNKRTNQLPGLLVVEQENQEDQRFMPNLPIRMRNPMMIFTSLLLYVYGMSLWHY